MREFDELNTQNERNIIPIDEFFDDIEELTEKEKEKRKKFAEEMTEGLLFIFAIFLTMKEHEYMDKQYIVNLLYRQYIDIARKYEIEIDNALDEYIKQFSQEIIDTTEKNSDTEYFTSEDRATVISENEAMTSFGYSELSKAINDGYTRKMWITEGDNKVRKTHREVDRETIPIDEPFIVGDSLMMFAHDGITFNADVKELANCRCITKYLK